ncbi:MAG: heparan-alpha-glucosaminide N-acetyltransferase [Faecousia sp.]
MTEQKQRIWELDALRGICILGMIVVHSFFDLSYFGGISLTLPGWFVFIRQYGHVLFVLISGICVTLASRSFQRGVVVFGAGLLITYVTMFMDQILGFSNMRIWFGILHMLGLCMMLYPLFKRLPSWALAVFGVTFVALGFWFETFTVSVDFLFPLGLRSGGIFTGSDYFPIFPGFGWFLVGAFLGKTVYRKKQSLLPRVNAENAVLRFFRFCGKHSLVIYLAHQPILSILTLLIFG